MVVGGLVCAAVLAQLGVFLFSSVARAVHERRLRRLQLDAFRAEVATLLRQRAAAAETVHGWQGYRKFEVREVVPEAEGIRSIYLTPHDGRPLPDFRPGQFLTFQLQIPGEAKPLVRCYSLSDCARQDAYRITVKQVPPPRDRPELPPGRSSTYFNEVVRAGDILDVKAPSGAFFLDSTRDTPVVLIGGGIGITPVLSMLNSIVESGSKRETWFFLGVRNGSEHVLQDHLAAIDREHDNVHLRVCYSSPGPGDVAGRDYQVEGRVGVELFQQQLPSNNYDYYICGPPPMMESLTTGLEEWGVPRERVHFEAFGPASIKKAGPPARAAAPDAGPRVQVVFSRSGRSLEWDASSGSLLELAEANDIALDSGCRAGNCGTCLVAIKSGKVSYPTTPSFDPEEGSCLTCVCVPDGPLEVDA